MCAIHDVGDGDSDKHRFSVVFTNASYMEHDPSSGANSRAQATALSNPKVHFRRGSYGAEDVYCGFWVVTRYSLVGNYQRFRGTYRLDKDATFELNINHLIHYKTSQ
jgi:hypothetical protein